MIADCELMFPKTAVKDRKKRKLLTLASRNESTWLDSEVGDEGGERGESAILRRVIWSRTQFILRIFLLSKT